MIVVGKIIRMKIWRVVFASNMGFYVWWAVSRTTTEKKTKTVKKT